MRLLVTRAEPGATATAARIAATGADALVAPLLVIEPLVWTPPEGRFDALALTSANAARHAGPGLAAFAHLRCLAVGGATAAAARAAGLADVTSVDGDAQALFDAAAGLSRVLHLTGRDRTAVVLQSGLTVVAVPVYRARLVSLADAAVQALEEGGIDAVLLASARTARHFAAECDRLGLDRATIAIAAISPAVAAAAGPGWRAVAVAAAPNDTALLAAAGVACDKGD